MHKEGKTCIKRTSSRPLALEEAYVHSVYKAIAINTSSCSPVRSHIKEFLFDHFEMGSILLDVGCGDGKYLNINPDIVIIGLEKCYEWFYNDLIKYKTMFCGDKQLITGDVMNLPFRDEFFDGILCCGVLHHVSTQDRRVQALKEITRIMKIGGKLLLTVTSGPLLGRELQSQDVLIKLDKFQNQNNDSDSESETDSSSSTSSYSSNYANTMYESCNSPTSEYGSCYSFVRKALQKFSLTSSLQSRRTSINKSKTSDSSSLSKEEFPIELVNIDDDDSLSAAIDSPISSSTSLDKCNNKENTSKYSNFINSSSILTLIKEQIMSFQIQFKSKHNINNESNKKNGFLQRKLSQHGLNLPIRFTRNNSNNRPTNLNIAKQNSEQSVCLDQIKEINCEKNHFQRNPKNRLKEENNTIKCEIIIKTLQKSFSSESLEVRENTFDPIICKLVAYCSMPDLYANNACKVSTKLNGKFKNKAKLYELHYVQNNNLHNFQENYLHKTDAFLENKENLCDITKDTELISSDTTKIGHIEENDNLLEQEEMKDNIQNESEQQSQTNKFSKKLLRQRSFSADYQPEVPKTTSEQQRRFSASPNIGCNRNHNNQITSHHQQISIDSEESFVTIIPAMRSTRESVTEPFNNSDTFADFDNDYLTSSTDDDAYCEQINGEQTSQDDTSASIISTKSNERADTYISPSTPSPPTTLHRYFHIFRSGELEQLIEQNIQDLHVINSFYNERATSWCVIVEKVHVWTI